MKEEDALGQSPGIVITDSVARSLWPNQDAIARHLKVQYFGNTSYTVVGVTADPPDVRALGSRPQVFLPFGAPYGKDSALYFFVRSKTPSPQAMARSVRMIVTSVDPTVVATEIESLEEKLIAGLLPDKLRSIVTAGFAILASD